MPQLAKYIPATEPIKKPVYQSRITRKKYLFRSMQWMILFMACLYSHLSFSQDPIPARPATVPSVSGSVPVVLTSLGEYESAAFIVPGQYQRPAHVKSAGGYESLDAATKKQRIKIIAAANVVGYSAVMVGLYQAWYKDYPQGNFHVFNDNREWKQIDKIGHVYSAYAASKASMELWRWTGISRKKRIWIGGMSGAVYQTTIEVLDGFSTEWGWSWGDFAANVTGSGLVVAQELAWDEQRIQMKWSAHRKHYADPELINRSNSLFGNSTPERFLKDYNGQTYWLSATLKSFLPQSSIPAWLQVSLGTGAEGLFGGYENIGKDNNGNIVFSRPDIKRYRQWYLAPDVDLTRIKTNKKGIRLALQLLNVFKFPTPSLELSRGKLSWNWLHF